MGIFAKDIELASEVSNWKVCFQVLPLRGWSLCEIMDQAGTGFYKREREIERFIHSDKTVR